MGRQDFDRIDESKRAREQENRKSEEGEPLSAFLIFHVPDLLL